MTSILTNSSATTALKVLRQTESALGVTQERISTGLKVNNAKDDASTWAIAQGIKADVSSFKTIGEGLTMAGNALKTASGAANTIKDEITKISNNIAKAQTPGADKAAIQSAIDSSLKAITNAAQGASFNGTNLLQGTDTLKVLSGLSRDASGTATANFIDVARSDLTLTGGLSMLKGLNVSDDALATNANAGKQQLTVDLVTATAGAAGTMSLSYTNAAGEAKSVALNYVSGATKEATIENFVSTFGDKLKADGVEVTNDGSGKMTLTAAGQGVKLGQVTGVGTGLGFVATQASQAVLDFAATAVPDIGKEFSLNVTMAGKDYGYKLRIVADTSGTTGAVMGTDDDGSKIIAVRKSAITDGTTLASTLASALNTGAASEFVTTTADATHFGVVASGTKLTLSGFANAGGATPMVINSFDQPTADFSKLQATVDAAQKVAISAAQAFGTGQSQAETQKEFLSTLVDSLEAGVGALIDADITAESARLNALQTQQQLATQSLSIANQSTQLVMSLFR